MKSGRLGQMDFAEPSRPQITALTSALNGRVVPGWVWVRATLESTAA